MIKSNTITMAVLACLACGLAPSAACAEGFAGGLAGVQPGMRVRATLDAENPVSGRRIEVTGTVSAMDDSSLVVQRSRFDPPLVLPRARVVKLERSVEPSRRHRSAVIGFCTGAVLGVVVSRSSGDNTRTYGYSTSSEDGFQRGLSHGALFGAVGAALGAMVGPGERWRVVTGGWSLGSAGPRESEGRIAVGLRF